jgi:glucitol/sorbitol PTS system EIIA component
MEDMIYYQTKVLTVGPDAADMVAGGVLILFAEPVPDALAEVSVVHRPSTPLSGPIRPGDTALVGEQELEFTAVGELAAQNLEKLGHVVLYVNQPDQKLLPGAVHATGTLQLPEPGQTIEFRGPSA